MNKIKNPFTGHMIELINSFAPSISQIAEYAPVIIEKKVFWIMPSEPAYQNTKIIHIGMTNSFHAMNLKILSLSLSESENVALFEKIRKFVHEQGPDMTAAVEKAFDIN